MPELQLHDIKPLVEIPDSSSYYFSALVAVLVLLLALLAWGFVRFLQRKQAIDMQALYRRKLQEITLENTKSAAYDLTFYGTLIEKDEEQTAYFQALIEALEDFKYKKEVDSFDAATLAKITHFMASVHG